MDSTAATVQQRSQVEPTMQLVRGSHTTAELSPTTGTLGCARRYKLPTHQAPMGCA